MDVNKFTSADKKKVKKLLVQADIKQADIARREKVGRALVSMVVAGDRKSPRVRRAIARALGLPVGALWADDLEMMDSRLRRAGMTKKEAGPACPVRDRRAA